MIGISETPRASGKKAASVGDLIHTSASGLVLVQERPLRAAGAYSQADRDAGGHALSVGASGGGEVRSAGKQRESGEAGRLKRDRGNWG